ncbi:hypothetical protein BpHYR1_015291 [Brachionus plicatilis]|uniref:Uncharacterized protein n=1 Tax=Brachionus plicatilis TaxID=10195 RepID=A0A3M7QRQ6_BRAPC|nr:hypothetical protein BpHYR1_015291 [Brachionus plicatilis]
MVAILGLCVSLGEKKRLLEKLCCSASRLLLRLCVEWISCGREWLASRSLMLESSWPSSSSRLSRLVGLAAGCGVQCLWVS